MIPPADGKGDYENHLCRGHSPACRRPLIELFDGSYDDCVLVVQTDTGLTGIGETESMAPAIQAIVRGPSAHNHARALANVLIGEDPSDPVALWHKMFEATDYLGRRGLTMHAIGGLDLALWDLHGKSKASLSTR